MYLFQTELADAEKSSADNLEALQTLIESRKSCPNSPRKMPTVIGTAGCCDSLVQITARARMEGCGLALLAVLGVLVVAMLISSTNASVSQDTDFSVVPPNISDRVLGLRQEGHKRSRQGPNSVQEDPEGKQKGGQRTPRSPGGSGGWQNGAR